MKPTFLEHAIATILTIVILVPILRAVQNSTLKMNERRAAGIPEPLRPWWARWRIWFWRIITVIFVYGILSPLLSQEIHG